MLRAPRRLDILCRLSNRRCRSFRLWLGCSRLRVDVTTRSDDLLHHRLHFLDAACLARDLEQALVRSEHAPRGVANHQGAIFARWLELDAESLPPRQRGDEWVKPGRVQVVPTSREEATKGDGECLSPRLALNELSLVVSSGVP